MPSPLYRSAFTRPGVTPAEVLAHHAAFFGNLRMSDEPATPVPTSPEPTPAPSPKSLEDVIADLGLTPEQIAGRLEASKTWERRAKSDDRVDRSDYEAVKTKLDKAIREAETDNEKAIREAREQGASEARKETTNETIAALLRMGIRSRGLEGDALAEALADVDTINLSALADDKGLVNDEKVLRTINRLAGTASNTSTSTTGPDTGQGNRGKKTATSGVSAGADLFATSRGKKTTT